MKKKTSPNPKPKIKQQPKIDLSPKSLKYKRVKAQAKKLSALEKRV